MKTTIIATMAFFAAYPGWHSWNPRHAPTVRAIRRLTALGFLRTNEFGQAEFTGKVFDL